MSIRKSMDWEKEEKILVLLKEHPHGLYTKEITEMTGYAGHTVWCYIKVLEAKGKVTRRVIGNANVYFWKED